MSLYRTGDLGLVEETETRREDVINLLFLSVNKLYLFKDLPPSIDRIFSESSSLNIRYRRAGTRPLPSILSLSSSFLFRFDIITMNRDNQEMDMEGMFLKYVRC